MKGIEHAHAAAFEGVIASYHCRQTPDRPWPKQQHTPAQKDTRLILVKGIAYAHAHAAAFEQVIGSSPCRQTPDRPCHKQQHTPAQKETRLILVKGMHMRMQLPVKARKARPVAAKHLIIAGIKQQHIPDRETEPSKSHVGWCSCAYRCI